MFVIFGNLNFVPGRYDEVLPQTWRVAIYLINVITVGFVLQRVRKICYQGGEEHAIILLWCACRIWR